MTCVNEKGAEKVTAEKNRELVGLFAVEVGSGDQFEIKRVFYTIDKTRIRTKEKIMGYTVRLDLSNNEGHKTVTLDDFNMKFSLLYSK